MFCGNCGARMPEGQAFCSNCGAPLTNQAPMQGAPAQQPTYQAPKAPKVPKARKPLLGWIIAIAATAAVVTGVVLGWSHIRNFVERTFSSPEKYYQSVEKRAIQSVTKPLDKSSGMAGLYENLLGGDSKTAIQGSVTVSVGSALTDLLSDAADTDMSWFKSAGVNFTVDLSHDDLVGGKATVQLNGTDLINADAVLDSGSHMAYFRVPEFSDQYVGIDLADLLQQYYYENGYDETYLILSSLVYGSDSEVQAILDAMPDPETLSALIERYVQIVTDNVSDVEKGSEEVEAGGVSCTYTTLTTEIDQKAMKAIVKDVIAEAKKDKDLKNIIISVAGAVGQDGEALYQEFLDTLDEVDVDDIDFGESTKIIMTVYVDGEGDVKGREFVIKMGGQTMATLRYLEARKGSKIGTEIVLDTPSSKISLAGKGTKNGDDLKETLTLKVTMDGDTHEFGTIELDGKSTDGNFVGDITITPSEELLDELMDSGEIPAVLEDLVRGVKIVLTNNSSEKRLDVSITVKSGSSELVSVHIECEKASPMNLAVPSGYVSPQMWMSSLDQTKLMVLVSNLQKAGMPMSLLSDLMG